MRRPLAFSSLLLFATFLSGCGGGGGGDAIPTPLPTETTLKYTLVWGERTRALQGPSSALSATVSLEGAGAGGTDILDTRNRAATLPGYSENVTSVVKVKPGPYRVLIRFYGGADASGDIVASATKVLDIANDGTGIDTITVANSIAQVFVNPDQTVEEGATSQLTFFALAAGGPVVAVSPGSARWEVTGGNDVVSVTPDGVAAGLKPGTARVRVTVDGISNEGDVTVPSNVEPAIADPSFDLPALTNGVWKQDDDVVGSPWSGDPHHGIANGSGSWGSHAHTGSQYGYIQQFGSLEQTISGLTVGRHYRIRMWIARRDGNVGANDGNPIIVYAGDTVILNRTSPTDDAEYTEVTTAPFTASATSVRIRIKGDSSEDRTTLVDDVHLEAAP